jgi:hypothetical protein
MVGRAETERLVILGGEVADAECRHWALPLVRHGIVVNACVDSKAACGYPAALHERSGLLWMTGRDSSNADSRCAG